MADPVRKPVHLLGPEALTDPATVRRKPDSTVAALERAGLYGIEHIELRCKTKHLIVIWVDLRPWAATAAEGYPTETVSLCIWDDDSIYAVPHQARERTWVHRNPDVILNPDLFQLRGQWGSLCLWYPGDPRGLRWEWPDGLDQYVTIVHRHLQAEEYARRHEGSWPAEDTPHGAGHHPLRTASTRDAALRWRPAC